MTREKEGNSSSPRHGSDRWLSDWKDKVSIGALTTITYYMPVREFRGKASVFDGGRFPESVRLETSGLAPGNTLIGRVSRITKHRLTLLDNRERLKFHYTDGYDIDDSRTTPVPVAFYILRQQDSTIHSRER